MNPVRVKWKDRVRTVAFMAALTAVFMSAVSGAHLLTRDAVSRNQTLHLKRAVLRAAGYAIPEKAADVDALYRERVRPAADPAVDGRLATAAAPDGSPLFLLRDSGPGLWGTIEAVVGYRADDLSLTGIAITEQNETPGLGARILEPWFADQFRGKRGDLRLVPEGARSPEPNAIDGITGASITSRAVRDIVNRASLEAAAWSAGEPVPPPSEGAE